MRSPPRHRSTLSVLLLCLFTTACTPVAVQSALAPGPSASALRPNISDRLYFGRSIPGGDTVTAADWVGFLRDVVTPRFPAGLTTWRAEGQWRDASGTIVHEESFVLELIHSEDPGAESAIVETIAEYRRRFRQESVLRVRTRVDVSF